MRLAAWFTRRRTTSCRGQIELPIWLRGIGPILCNAVTFIPNGSYCRRGLCPACLRETI